ncbi:hypothetical protein N431DRAFT_443373 [Stipitochalara longipes BDJ]|nr:hypothetical protein N431DRAFT_443373 [Stipitochalara longipes BDJ]
MAHQAACQTSQKQKMAAITTITNPFAKDRIMIFTSNKNFNLALESRSLVDKDVNALLSAILPSADAKPAPFPVLASPSALTSFVYEDSLRVYGVIEERNTLKIALISPVYESVVHEGVANGHISGLVDPNNDASWIYYHNIDLEGRVQLFQKQISGAAQALPGIDFIHQTRLSAVFDGETKWLFYQKRDSRIGIYDCTTFKDNDITGTEQTAKDQTNIGACVVPADAAAGRPKGRIYVYFASNKNSLFRAWSDIDNGVFPGNTANMAKVNSTDTVSETSQISVHADPAKKRNLIYVVTSNSTKVNVIEDKWDSK